VVKSRALFWFKQLLTPNCIVGSRWISFKEEGGKCRGLFWVSAGGIDENYKNVQSA
jgi:hypothetical protein